MLMKASVRTWALLGLLGIMASSTGCGNYWANRRNDVKDFFDVGVTTTSKPAFAFYVGFLNVLPVGYANVEGTLHGMGGGRTGAVPVRQRACGVLLWGKERFGYGEEFAPDDPGTPDAWRVGPLGLALGPRPPARQRVNCPKMFHFGWLGFTLNCKFGQLPDLILGFTTFDLSGDDVRSEVETAGV